MTPGLVAHVTVPPPNGFFDHSDGIVGSDHVAGKVGGQHRQIVQMIAGREDVVARNAKLPRNFAERGRDSEVRKFVALLLDTDRFGSSLGPALRTHAKYLRTRMRQRAQEAARKVSAKLIFPVFFLIFPSVLLVTLGPAVLHMMKQFAKMVK